MFALSHSKSMRNFLIFLVALSLGLIFVHASAELPEFTASDEVQVSQVDNNSSVVEGKKYESIVIFRNDDVQRMSDDFLDVNQIFIDNEVPVSNGIVVEWFDDEHNSSESYSEACQDFREFRDNNRDLIEYSSHGLTHDGHEFRNLDWMEGEDKLEEIDFFFENCLNDEVEVFIPPQNDISSTSRLLLEEFGYKVISGDRRMKWQENKAVLTTNKSKFLDERTLHLGQSEMFIHDWNTDPVTFKDLSEIKDSFDYSLANNHIHIQTLHYNQMAATNNTHKLEELIDYMDGHDVRFMSFEEIINLFERDKIVSVENGWIIKE